MLIEEIIKLWKSKYATPIYPEFLIEDTTPPYIILLEGETTPTERALGQFERMDQTPVVFQVWASTREAVMEIIGQIDQLYFTTILDGTNETPEFIASEPARRDSNTEDMWGCKICYRFAEIKSFGNG